MLGLGADCRSNLDWNRAASTTQPEARVTAAGPDPANEVRSALPWEEGELRPRA